MLKDDAIKRYKELESKFDYSSSDKPIYEVKLLFVYRSGWDDHGEWTCCQCGAMIGKNLNGDKPFLLARQHVDKCKESIE